MRAKSNILSPGKRLNMNTLLLPVRLPHRASWRALCGVLIRIVLAVNLSLVLAGLDSTTTLNVKDFGAKGDGLSDDYEAMQAAAVAICRSPGATLVYPPGVYRINRYRINGGPNANKVQDIRYMGCTGITITGSGARIDVRGDFRRSADYSDGPYVRSYANSVIPFEFINSFGFHLVGFEVNGNVDQMSRDARVVEGTGTGILTTNCKDYSIENLFVHHFATDGITLGGNSEVADQRIRLDHVTSTHNARQGLSIIQVRQATIINSVFNDTGRTGSYGNHAPAAGVDVEPMRRPPEEDIYTGLIIFDNCRFEENIGSQFVSGWPGNVESITVENSQIKATLPDTLGTAFMNVPRTGVTTNNTFALSSGHWVYLAVRLPGQYADIAHLTYSRNTFRLGDNGGILAPIRQAPVDLVYNDIRIESTRADLNPLRLDYVNLIEGNHFFEGNSGYSGLRYTILYERGKMTVRNNSYDTDRNSPDYFSVYYGSGIVTSGETFPDSAHFRPVYQNR
jgi:hypothetical protein